MTNSSHPNMVCLLSFAVWVLVLQATSCSQKRSSAPEQTAKTHGLDSFQIAKTYGLDSFGQIEAIRYTWNDKTGRYEQVKFTSTPSAYH